MTPGRLAAVIGSAVITPADAKQRSLEEVIYDVSQAALRDAEITLDDINGIVVASNDQLDGRAISVMAASGSVGGVDRDILSTPSAGEHAFVLGVLRVASKLYRTQLVVSWSPTEAHPLHEAERLAADPYFHRRLPLDDLSAMALQASALADRVPGSREIAEGICAKRGSAPGKASTSSPGRWPLTVDMVSPPITGAVALVLGSEEFVDERKRRPAAWVQGMGWATEPSFLGDRDLADAPALNAAATRAYAEAGITSPRTAFEVAEITDATPYQTLLVAEGLGLSPRADWARDFAQGTFSRPGAMSLNPSGGVHRKNPVFCTGLIRIAEAAMQVRGCAANQIAGVRRALAHAASGFAMQYQTVVVLGQAR